MYKIYLTRLRMLGSFIFHFGTSDKLDPYLVVAAGSNKTSIKIEFDDPYFGEHNIPGIFPVAMRIAIGMRYFITDNIGLNAELGLGQALMQAGITAKF